MPITSFTTDVPGQIGVNPRLVRMISTDNLATVTTAGYLNVQLAESGFPIFSTDFIFMNYNNGASFSIFTPSIANSGIITLVDTAGSGTITLPTIANHIATYTNTSGALSEDPATAISGGNIQAGLSGTAGTISSFPSTASKGSLVVAAVANTGNTVTTISNAAMGQASVISIPDPAGATANFAVAPSALVSGNVVQASGTAGLVADSGVAGNKILTSSFATPDIAADVVLFNITCDQAALATAGKVNIIVSSGSKRYQIINIFLNSGGTNFSGGGGNRLLAITDGTTVYTVIPATNIQTLINGGWGITTVVPYPVSAAINTPTVAGANLYAQYSGGTTDYTAGSLVLTVKAIRIA
jgi:hypothetical protein